MKKITLCLLICVTRLSAQVPNGTYVPINNIAKSLYYAKFVFNGGKVKGYMGVNGIALPAAYEYSYTLSGNVLSLSEAGKNGSVEFTYDKAKDQISLSTGIEGSEAVWGKEGVNYVPPTSTSNTENSSVTTNNSGNSSSNISYLEQPKVYGTAPTVTYNGTTVISWINVSNAQYYTVNWSLGSKKGSLTTKSTSTTITFPNESGVAYVDVFACGSYNGKYVQSKNLQIPINVSPSSESSNSVVTLSDYTRLVNYLISNGDELVCRISGGNFIKLQSSAAGKIYIDGKANDIKSILNLDKGIGYYDINTLLGNQNFNTALKISKICSIISDINLGMNLIDVANTYKENGDWGLAIITAAFDVVLFCADAPVSVFLSEVTKTIQAGEIYQNYYAEKDFTVIGSAVKRKNPNTDIADGYYISNINATNGFQISADLCCVDKPLRICITYASDARGGKLIVNDITQAINFPSTNWSIGQQFVSGTYLRKGTNIIKFYGDNNTSYAPDIYAITIQE